MRWLINMLRGRVTVRVTGASPERLINLCAAHAVAFWGVKWIDETSFWFTVALWDWKRVRELAGKVMCELTAPSITGLPAQAVRMRKRYAFLAGMVLCFATLIILPRFVLVVEVEGNETVPDAVILSELRRLGVKPGAYAAGIEEKAVANRALMTLKDLSFLAVNIHGCRAQILVHEAQESPKMRGENIPTDVVSSAAGIVLDVKLAAGQPLVTPGDTVAEGDVLITGFMDLPEYTFSEVDMGQYVVHAEGEVIARTWRTLKNTIPITVKLKSYTGKEKSLWALNFSGGRLNFYQNSGISYERYDKITKTKSWEFPGGGRFPISLTEETVREYILTDEVLDRDMAIDHLEDGLRRELDEILQETDGECVRLDYIAAVDGDLLTVTMLAECVEQIGVSVEREGETGFIPPFAEEKTG